MGTTETVIAFTDVVKHIKQHENKSRLQQLLADIESDKTGNIYLFAKGDVRFSIKRYRTGRFVKQVWN